MAEDCRQAVVRFDAAANVILKRLDIFREVVGTDAFPRAFVDTQSHLRGLLSRAEEARRGMDDDALSTDKLAQLQRMFDGAVRQVQILAQVLDRCSPGKHKGVTKALKDLYNEKDIPRVQKTLLGYVKSTTI